MQIAEEIKSTLNIKNKKKLGAFYTPYSLCTILSKWAIQSCDKKVIEPSFGECSFIEASFNRLKELECSNPEENIYGCDIDPNAFSFLTNNLNDKVKIENFILKDFMHTAIEDFDQKSFDVSVGNPPYISSHNLTIEEIKLFFNIIFPMLVRLNLGISFVDIHIDFGFPTINKLSESSTIPPPTITPEVSVVL